MADATAVAVGTTPDAAADGVAAPDREPDAHRKEAAGAGTPGAGAGTGAGAIASFLRSKEGKHSQKQILRGAFGLLKKKL